MQQYVVKRLLLFIPTMFMVSFLVFAMVRLIPGDVVDLMLAEHPNTYLEDDLRARLGLDQSIVTQYINWIGRILRGDFGDSLWSGRTALTEVRVAFPVTMELGILTLVLGSVCGVFIGIVAAIRADSVLDYGLRSFSILALSVPHFWLATLVLVYPAIWWGILPAFGYTSFTDDPLVNLRQFLLPAIILGLRSSATYMRFMRTALLDVVREDYIRTAQSKGLRERVVIYRHALKNALIPVVTLIGLSIPAVLSGTVIIETIFVLPGMGRLTLQAVTQRDYPLLQLLILVYTSIVILSNLIVDILYGWLDPRIRYQ